jgi:hypothetical protein
MTYGVLGILVNVPNVSNISNISNLSHIRRGIQHPYQACRTLAAVLVLDWLGGVWWKERRVGEVRDFKLIMLKCSPPLGRDDPGPAVELRIAPRPKFHSFRPTIA